eukprot:Hpha_TRINITY_DN3333_c0_g1::TRINITY_DN3333_c0_g1_i1::g.172301::m.172301
MENGRTVGVAVALTLLVVYGVLQGVAPTREAAPGCNCPCSAQNTSRAAGEGKVVGSSATGSEGGKVVGSSAGSEGGKVVGSSATASEGEVVGSSTADTEGSKVVQSIASEGSQAVISVPSGRVVSSGGSESSPSSAGTGSGAEEAEKDCAGSCGLRGTWSSEGVCKREGYCNLQELGMPSEEMERADWPKWNKSEDMGWAYPYRVFQTNTTEGDINLTSPAGGLEMKPAYCPERNRVPWQYW